MSKQTEQEKVDYFMWCFNDDIKLCIKQCDDLIKSDYITNDRKDFYQRVKQILIDKQK